MVIQDTANVHVLFDLAVRDRNVIHDTANINVSFLSLTVKRSKKRLEIKLN